MKKPSLRPEDILASPEKAELNDAIRDAMYERAVEAWREYYDAAEQLDRDYPHHPPPPRYRSKGVSPNVLSRDLAKRKRDRFKQILAKLKETEVKLDPDVNQQAKAAALELHEKEIEPCVCLSCEKGI